MITAFRKTALHEVGYWSPDMLTEDIDITWKLQRARLGRALRAECAVLDPDARDAARPVAAAPALGDGRRAGVDQELAQLLHWRQRAHVAVLLGDVIVSVFWAYMTGACYLLWLAGLVLPCRPADRHDAPAGLGRLILGATCLIAVRHQPCARLRATSLRSAVSTTG